MKSLCHKPSIFLISHWTTPEYNLKSRAQRAEGRKDRHIRVVWYVKPLFCLSVRGMRPYLSWTMLQALEAAWTKTKSNWSSKPPGPARRDE